MLIGLFPIEMSSEPILITTSILITQKDNDIRMKSNEYIMINPFKESNKYINNIGKLIVVDISEIT